MMTPSILLLLAAPSMASSFIAVSSPRSRVSEPANANQHSGHPAFTSNKYRSVLMVSPGGSSEPSSTTPPSNDVENPPVDASVPPPPPADTTTPVAPVAPTAASAAAVTSLMGPNASEPGILRQKFQNLPWRCLAIPLLVGLFYLPDTKTYGNIATGILFGFASYTDWLDGYLARRWDISSPFGAFLDPVADKLMVSTSLILLTGRYGKSK